MPSTCHQRPLVVGLYLQNGSFPWEERETASNTSAAMPGTLHGIEETVGRRQAPGGGGYPGRLKQEE